MCVELVGRLLHLTGDGKTGVRAHLVEPREVRLRVESRILDARDHQRRLGQVGAWGVGREREASARSFRI